MLFKFLRIINIAHNLIFISCIFFLILNSDNLWYYLFIGQAVDRAEENVGLLSQILTQKSWRYLHI